jgi:hypothetical protein
MILFCAANLTSSQAQAQTAKNPTCVSTGGIASNNTLSTAFICLGDLDGNGQEQIVFGTYNNNTSGENITILENTGAVRKRICTAANCTAITVQ